MTIYYIDFVNNTPTTWTMAAFQTLPDNVGLDSVAWLQTTAADGGTTGVSWEVDYDAVLANYSQESGIGVYSASQTKATALGTQWNVVDLDGIQQLQLGDGPVSAGTITIKNTSLEPANVGIGMSGQGAVFKQDVDGGVIAQFDVSPTYYAALFTDVQLGQVISSDLISSAQTVAFPAGMNKATLTAAMNGTTLELTLTYSNFAAVSAKDARKALHRATPRAVAALA